MLETIEIIFRMEIKIVKDYKCFVFDLDGTLLNSAKEITDEVQKVISLLKAKDKQIFIATGRHALIASKYIYELDLNTPLIACNGALIKDVRNNEIIYMKLIKSVVASKVITYCMQEQLDFLVYTPKAIYHSENSSRVNVVIEYNNSVNKQFRAPLYNVQALDVLKQDIIKVLVRSDDGNIFEKLNNDINKDGSLTIVKSDEDLIDIMTSGVSKGDGLNILAKHLDIDLESTVAFGDSHNDISMFEVAGLSIAMGNAEEELKRIADYITLSNDESGISHAIYKYVL